MPDWLETKLRRTAIRIALRKPMPERLSLGRRENDNFEIRLGTHATGFVFWPEALLPNGLEGDIFIHGQPRTKASMANNQIARETFEIVHHYQQFRIDTQSAFRFVIQQWLRYPFFAAWKYRFTQSLFNRRRLARRDRMAVLRYIFECTVDDRNFKTSELSLPTQLYGIRFYGRSDHSVLIAHYRMILQSLVQSGDLKEIEHSYILTPKAIATLDEHERQVERHADNVRTQRRMLAVTIVLAIMAALQVGATVWQEINPDPPPAPPHTLQAQPAFPTSPMSTAPAAETLRGNGNSSK